MKKLALVMAMVIAVLIAGCQTPVDRPDGSKVEGKQAFEKHLKEEFHLAVNLPHTKKWRELGYDRWDRRICEGTRIGVKNMSLHWWQVCAAIDRIQDAHVGIALHKKNGDSGLDNATVQKWIKEWVFWINRDEQPFYKIAEDAVRLQGLPVRVYHYRKKKYWTGYKPFFSVAVITPPNEPFVYGIIVKNGYGWDGVPTRPVILRFLKEGVFRFTSLP